MDVVGVGTATGRIIIHNIRLDETLMSFTQDWGPVCSLSFRTGILTLTWLAPPPLACLAQPPLTCLATPPLTCVAPPPLTCLAPPPLTHLAPPPIACLTPHPLTCVATPPLSSLQVWSLMFFSPVLTDGPPIVASASPQGHIAFWDLERRQLAAQQRHAHRTAVAGATFLHGEPLLVTNGADNAIKVRRPQTNH